ncbi:hypothetical protein P3102_33910 [Amycolatopsis sp. QT-25]|uniref:hypothetical protein n=1 Tax=Amycolatopsis sp. QT-25 TaxID=3034022 RepID=UPI0023ECECAD|nr:hypothetical protein [Amycolatopsis sp. QT-25]WET78979.1 hypothetical protein P3102_33910 [Amycolatopsis sp. QT-25]
MSTVKATTAFAARAAHGELPSSGYVAIDDTTTGELIASLRDEHTSPMSVQQQRVRVRHRVRAVRAVCPIDTVRSSHKDVSDTPIMGLTLGTATPEPSLPSSALERLTSAP